MVGDTGIENDDVLLWPLTVNVGDLRPALFDDRGWLFGGLLGLKNRRFISST